VHLGCDDDVLGNEGAVDGAVEGVQRQVDGVRKGLYIVNGRKVVIKWAKWELVLTSERERARTKFTVVIK